MASNPQDKIEAKVNSLSLNDDEGDTSSKRKNFQKIQGVEFFMQASKLEKEGHISEGIPLTCIKVFILCGYSCKVVW